MINTSEAKALLKKYQKGTCTDEESALVESWYLGFEKKGLAPVSEETKQIQLEGIRRKLPVTISKNIKPTVYNPFLPLAAALLIALSFGIYFYKDNYLQSETQKVTQIPKVSPGGNKAFLILGDGSRLSLNDASMGEIAKQSDISITKSKEGQIIYSLSGSGKALNKPVSYNTIETPRGGQYQINLPDGTKVWLNAASSIKFPTWFVGNERKVELTGEGYFEVEPHKNKPFKVYSNNQVVEVLGTHFNINSYDDEEVRKTTLVEGSIKVILSNGEKASILKPGQQLSVVGNRLSISEVDTDLYTAWKNGFFQFKSSDLQSVMKQISRWYNVEVEYKNKIPVKLFSGKLHRNIQLNKMLEALTYYEVKFKVDGKKIIVNP